MKQSSESQKNNWWPRKHISWSQFEKWRGSPNEYIRHYCPASCQFCGVPLWRPDWGSGYCHECAGPVMAEITNTAMQIGLQIASMLEHNGVKHRDPVIENYRRTLPKYPYHEFPIDIDYIGITFTGKLDGWDPENLVIGEYKTGKDWTAERAEKHRQLDFYQLLVWRKTGKLAERIRLHWIPTRFNFDTMQPELTGEPCQTFETFRTKKDAQIMAADALRVHREIGKACGSIPNPYVK